MWSGGTSEDGEEEDPENCSRPEQHLDRKVTWCDGGPAENGLDGFGGVPYAGASRSVSWAAGSSLRDERAESLDEMIALLPTLRAMAEERGTAGVVTTDQESQNFGMNRSSLSSLNCLTEEKDLEGEEATRLPVCGQANRNRSTVVSVLQHQSKGLGATRRSSDESSSDDDDGDSDGAAQSEPANRQEYVRLSRDAYSMMYYSAPRSVAFAFAMATYLLQMFILFLIMVDIVNMDTPYNPLNIPAGVDTVVRAAQFVAILIAVATQDDLITAISELHVGYHREALPGEGNGGARWQWLLSIFCRFSQGGLALCATFILIMQASEVVGLFLDFLAVTFVSTLDDIVFELAREGYFAQRLKDEARKMTRVRVPKKGNGTHLFRPILFFLVSAGMLIGWGFVTSEQMKGDYLSCGSISVQMGDDFLTNLAFFSGLYEVRDFNRYRPVYLERNLDTPDRPEGKGMFAYCDDIESWTFSYPSSQHEVADPCDWKAKSAPTDAYDIMDVMPTDWYVLNTEANKPVPFEHFDMHSADCNRILGNGEVCSSAGRCVDTWCICDPGRIGVNCEYQSPCETVEVNTEFGGFVGSTQWSDRFSILHHCNTSDQLLTVYGRPVYISGHKDVKSAQAVVFTGRRWVVFLVKDLIPSVGHHISSLDTTSSSCMLPEIFNSFHAEWTYFKPEFVSSPVDIGTRTDSATPVGLTWYQARTHDTDFDIYASIPTRLICSICDSVWNPCNNGDCINGKCNCKAGTFGTLCQIKSFALCRSITIRLEDGVGLDVTTLSGVYHLLDSEESLGITINGRVVYFDQQRHGAVFAFCEEELAWTFTVLSDHHGNSSWIHNLHTVFDPCAQWTAISPRTESYDITTVPSNWLVRRSQEASEGIPLRSFNLWCNDCNQNREPCNGAGTCDDGGDCTCDEGRFGLNCALTTRCDSLSVDVSFELQGQLGANYDLLRNDDDTNVVVNARPVFYGSVTPVNKTRSTMTDYVVILYTSCRWYTIVTSSFPLLSNGTTPGDLAHYLSNDFHSYFSSYAVKYISDEDCNAFYPTKLEWYVSDPSGLKRPADPDKPIGAKLHCTFCHKIYHPCYNDGECVDSLCSCPIGSYGSHCQINVICKSLTISFAYAHESEIRLRSGIYDLSHAETKYSGRPVYVLKGENNAMVAYCVKDSLWTFSIWDS